MCAKLNEKVEWPNLLQVEVGISANQLVRTSVSKRRTHDRRTIYSLGGGQATTLSPPMVQDVEM